MSHQTCTITPQVKEALKSLRFRKAKTNAALLLKIDPQSLEVITDHLYDPVEISDLPDELPDSAPRFLIISFELHHKDGRISYPLCGVYYNPEGSSLNNRMLYASTGHAVFVEAEVTGKVFDLVEAEELSEEWIVKHLESSKTRP